MLIVSYYTPDYAEHADRLRSSLMYPGARFWIEAVEDAGSWVENCSRKAAFVLRALRSTEESILWLDADAEVMRELEYINFWPRPLDRAGDFAIYRNPVKAPKKWMCRSGTVWFNNTPAAHRLCEEWVRLCEEKPKRFDQESLWMAWESMEADIRVHWLPITYCQLFDDKPGSPFNPVPDPHIVHYQASRETRKRRQREKRGS